MPLVPNTDILVLTATEAKELAGKTWSLNGRQYRFKSYDPNYPGQPPWKAGAEGKAYALMDGGSPAAYMKFFATPSPKRLRRTTWLVAQRLHAWLPSLAGAPLLWADTRQTSRPQGITFDFAGCLAKAVQGRTWQELKFAIAGEGETLPIDIRLRCVRDLIFSAAAIESAQIVHGDLSPNNIIIDPNCGPGTPALCVIDFDAFVASAAAQGGSLTVAEGGTYGTPGYCPPDLVAHADAGDTTVTPCSDRYARDMLILEILFMSKDQNPELPPSKWDRGWLRRQLQELLARFRREQSAVLTYLDVPRVFSMPETLRPSSVALINALGLRLPPRPSAHPIIPAQAPTPSPRPAVAAAATAAPLLVTPQPQVQKSIFPLGARPADMPYAALGAFFAAVSGLALAALVSPHLSYVPYSPGSYIRWSDGPIAWGRVWGCVAGFIACVTWTTWTFFDEGTVVGILALVFRMPMYVFIGVLVGPCIGMLGALILAGLLPLVIGVTLGVAGGALWGAIVDQYTRDEGVVWGSVLGAIVGGIVSTIAWGTSNRLLADCLCFPVFAWGGYFAGNAVGNVLARSPAVPFIYARWFPLALLGLFAVGLVADLGILGLLTIGALISGVVLMFYKQYWGHALMVFGCVAALLFGALVAWGLASFLVTLRNPSQITSCPPGSATETPGSGTTHQPRRANVPGDLARGVDRLSHYLRVNQGLSGSFNDYQLVIPPAYSKGTAGRTYEIAFVGPNALYTFRTNDGGVTWALLPPTNPYLMKLIEDVRTTGLRGDALIRRVDEDMNMAPR